MIIERNKENGKIKIPDVNGNARVDWQDVICYGLSVGVNVLTLIYNLAKFTL